MWSLASTSVLGGLAPFLLCVCFVLSPETTRAAESPGFSLIRARSLDALLQDFAYRAFHRPRTGRPYNGSVPSNLTGIHVAAMRLRSGSLRRWGVASYNEFQIPKGVLEHPYVERLVLVYQNLGNWSAFYYPPPAGYIYLAPVLGLLAYDASNLSATNLPELNIEASRDPILIKFQNAKSAPDAKCIYFDLNGVSNLSDLVLSSTCSTIGQGHFSVVGKSIAPSPEPVLPPAPPAGETKKGTGSKVGVIVGSVVGGSAVLVLLGFLALWLRKYKHRRELQHMEKTSDVGEALQITSVGGTKAPTAMATRTQPVLESEYVP